MAIAGPNGNGGSSQSKSWVGWLPFSFQILGFLLAIAVLWGAMDQRISHLESEVSRNNDREERLLRELSEVRASVSRTEENTRHLEQQVGSLGDRVDRLTDLLTKIIIDSNNHNGER